MYIKSIRRYADLTVISEFCSNSHVRNFVYIDIIKHVLVFRLPFPFTVID